MPLAKFKLLREISSEDVIHSAANIIHHVPGRKWKTKTVGETSAHIIIELEQPQRIIGIDIGNEHSAFIDVKVSKSGCAPTDFTDLLVTCSFMTPFESKNSININRVRCFSKDALINDSVCEKWNLVKVLCTQPFNKFVQYGLSFIKLHVDAENENANKPKTCYQEGPPKKIILREVSSDTDSESDSLFNRWKNNKYNGKNETFASSIRNAAQSKQSQQKCSSINCEDNAKVFQSKISQKIGHDKEIQAKVNAFLRTNKKNENVQASDDYCGVAIQTKEPQLKNARSKSEDEEHEKAKSTTGTSFNARFETNYASPNKKKPLSAGKEKLRHNLQFNELLRGVVFVISGIQNPGRGNVRKKALSMGAKYRPDWGADCTHLICAFKNTPKYNEVLGKGKIVSPKWVEECYKKKMYIPWRRFALTTVEAAMSESDDEVLVNIQQLQITDKLNKQNNNKNYTSTKLEHIDTSSTDTDDEIQRLRTQSFVPSLRKKKEVDFNIYDETTDEEQYPAKKFKKIQ